MPLIRKAAARRDYRCWLSLITLAMFLCSACRALTISTPLTVNFQGVYVDETCDVLINGISDSETITLPRINNYTLRNNGGEAASTPFTIRLEGCPAGKTMKLVFNSSLTGTDSATGNLLNQVGSNFSKNAQLRIRKETGEQMIINDTNTAQDYVIPAGGGAVTHQYSVSYFSTRPLATTSGYVQTNASITVDYQ